MVRARQSKDGLAQRRIFQGSVFVESRRDENWKNELNDKGKSDHHACSPNPPGSRGLSKYRVKGDKKERQRDQPESQTLELVTGPRTEGLGRESVFVFAVKAFINRQREGQRRCQDDVGDTVKRDLQCLESRYALGEIPEPGGEA